MMLLSQQTMPQFYAASGSNVLRSTPVLALTHDAL
jgi:hypothetical protein